jgi:hypothetical protein
MTNPINVSGAKLEKKLSNFLKEYNYTFKSGGNSDIDFIIETVSKKIYADCTNQNSSGSVIDKLPQKIFKYYRKHKMDKFYIIRGLYKDFPKPVLEHIKFLEEQFNVEVFILAYDDFVKIVEVANNISL